MDTAAQIGEAIPNLLANSVEAIRASGQLTLPLASRVMIGIVYWPKSDDADGCIAEGNEQAPHIIAMWGALNSGWGTGIRTPTKWSGIS